MPPNQNPTPEQSVQPVETGPSQPVNLPERPQPAPETQPRPSASEVAPAAQAPAQMPASAPVTTPPPNPAVAAPSSQALHGVGPNPQVAGDVDVIEKEWVDQANRIVEKTKGDPYSEEEAVEALQVDYLRKRYNHEVKKAPGGQKP